jgi:hypothetical protein
MMVCDQCKKNMPDRFEQINGHTVPHNICEECESKNVKAMKDYPSQNQRRRKQ